MVSYDPKRYQQAISGSSGVQSAGRITQPGIIEDEEESQFSFKPAPASFQLAQPQGRSTLGTIGSGIGKAWSAIDTPLSDRLGFKIPEMRGPFDELGNVALQEGTRLTNLAFAIPGVGAASRGFGLASKLARPGANLLGRVAPRAVKFGTQAIEPLGSWAGSPLYRAAAEVAGAGIIRGASEFAVDKLGPDAPWWQQVTAGLGAGLLVGMPAAKGLSYLPKRFAALTDQAKLGTEWAKQTKVALRHPSWHMKGDWETEIDRFTDRVGSDSQNYTFGIDQGTGLVTLRRGDTLQPDITEAIELPERQKVMEFFNEIDRGFTLGAEDVARGTVAPNQMFPEQRVGGVPTDTVEDIQRPVARIGPDAPEDFVDDVTQLDQWDPMKYPERAAQDERDTINRIEWEANNPDVGELWHVTKDVRGVKQQGLRTGEDLGGSAQGVTDELQKGVSLFTRKKAADALLKVLRFQKDFVDGTDETIGAGKKLVDFLSRNKKGKLQFPDVERLLYRVLKDLDYSKMLEVPNPGGGVAIVYRLDEDFVSGRDLELNRLGGKMLSAIADLVGGTEKSYLLKSGVGIRLDDLLKDLSDVAGGTKRLPQYDENFLENRIAAIVDSFIEYTNKTTKSRLLSPTQLEEDADIVRSRINRIFDIEEGGASDTSDLSSKWIEEGPDKLNKIKFELIEDFTSALGPSGRDDFFNGDLPFEPVYRDGYDSMREYGIKDLDKVPVSVRKNAEIDYGDETFESMNEVRVSPTDTWIKGSTPEFASYQRVIIPATKRPFLQSDRTFKHVDPDTQEVDAALLMDADGNIRDFSLKETPTKVELQQKVEIDTDPQTGRPVRRISEELSDEFAGLSDDAQFGITGYGAGIKLLLQAVENGARTISLFDGPMIRVAYALGFEPVGYVKYTDAYDASARRTIDPDIDAVEPNLVTMAYTGGPRIGGTQDGPGRNAGIRYRIDDQQGKLQQSTNHFKTVAGATKIANQISEISEDYGLRFNEFKTRGKISDGAAKIRTVADEANSELVSGPIIEDWFFEGSFGAEYRNNSSVMPKEAEKYLNEEFARVRLDPIGDNTVISMPVRGIGTESGVVKLEDAKQKRFVLDNDTGQLYPEDFYLTEGEGGFFERRIGLSVQPAGRFARITARQKLSIDYWNQLKSPQEGTLNRFQAGVQAMLGGRLGEVYDPDAAAVALQFSNAGEMVRKTGADMKRYVETQLYKSGLNKKIIVQEFEREDGTFVPMLGMIIPEGKNALRTELVELPNGRFLESPVYHLEAFLNPDEIEALREILIGDLGFLRAAEAKVLPNAGENVTGLSLAAAADISQQAGSRLPESGPINFWDLMEHSNLQTTPDGTAQLGVYVPRDFITLGPDDIDLNRGTVQNSQYLARQGRRGILNEVDADGNRVDNPAGFNNNEFQFLVDEIIKTNGNLEFQTDLPLIMAARTVAGGQAINAARFNEKLQSFGKNAYQYIQEKHPGLVEAKNIYAKAIISAQSEIDSLTKRRGELATISKDVNPLINNVYSNLEKIKNHFDQYSEVSAQDLLDLRRDIYRDVKGLAYLSGMLKAQRAMGVKLRNDENAVSRFLSGTIDEEEIDLFRFKEEWEELNPDVSISNKETWEAAELSAKEHFDNLYAADHRGIPKSGTKKWDKQIGIINRIDNLVGQIYRTNAQIMREFDKFGIGIPARLDQPLDPSLRSQAWDTDPQIPFAPPKNQEGPGVLDPGWEREGRSRGFGEPDAPISPGEPTEPKPRGSRLGRTPRWAGDENVGLQATDAARIREFNAAIKEEARRMDMTPEEYRAFMVDETNVAKQFTKSQVKKFAAIKPARRKEMQRIVNEYHDILTADATVYDSPYDTPLAYRNPKGGYPHIRRNLNDISQEAGTFDIGSGYTPELRRGRDGGTGRRTEQFLQYLDGRVEELRKILDIPDRTRAYYPQDKMPTFPKLIVALRRMLVESADKIDAADEALRSQGTTYVEAINSGLVTRDAILNKEIVDWMPTDKKFRSVLGEAYVSRVMQPILPEGQLAVKNMFKYMKQMVKEYSYLMKEAEKAVNELDDINRSVDKNQLEKAFTSLDITAKNAAIKRKVTEALMQARHREGFLVTRRMVNLSNKSERMANKVSEKIENRLTEYDESLEAAKQKKYTAERESVAAENLYQNEVRRYNGLQSLSDLGGVSSSLDTTVRTLPSVQRQFAATPSLQPPQPLFGSAGENWTKINGEMRAASATLDMSATTIQGLFAMGTHPVEAAKAWWLVTSSWLGNPAAKLAWYEENREEWLKMMRRGLALVDPQGNEEYLLQKNTPLQQALGKLTDRTATTKWIASTLGTGRDLSNLHFAETGNIFRFLMAKKLEQGNFIQKMVAQADGKPIPKMSEDQWRKQISVINNATGMAQDYRPSSISQVALFAPRFFRSQLRMVRDAAFRSDEAGDLARKYMLTTMMSAVALTTVLNEVRDETTEYNLWSVNERTGEAYFNTNALKIKNVGGRDISMLGVYDSLMGLIVSGMVQGPEAAVTRTLRSKASPLIGRTWDVISGQDFAGNQVIVEPVKDPIQTIETAARMAANSYTPFFIGDVAEDIAKGTAGAQSPFVMAGAFLGMKASPMTPNERRNYKVTEWVDSLTLEEQEEVGLLFRNDLNAMQTVTVNNYRDLTGKAKTLFDEMHPIYDELNIESLQKRAHRGDEGAQSQLNKILIDDIAMEEQEALASAFVKWRNGEPNYGDQTIPMDISKVLSELTDIRYRSWKAKKTQDRFFDQLTSNPVSSDPMQRALSQYYQALDSSTIAGTNFVIWNDFNRKLAELQREWTPAQVNAIESRSPARIHPVFKPFWDARTRINQSGYYDVAQQIYEKPIIQQAITAVLGEDIPEFYDSFSTMIEDLFANPDPQKQRVAYILSAINGKINPHIQQARKSLLMETPALRDDLVMIGRIRPQRQQASQMVSR